jgi:hypothetical protein
MFGGDSSSLTAAARYAQAHGGGTIGVESQSSAASAIVDSGADVAGLGGFSGRESTVSASWLAMEVRDGRLRWLLDESSSTTTARGGSSPFGTAGGGASPFGTRGGRSPFGARGGSSRGGSLDDRQGSDKVIALAEKVGRKVTFTSSSGTKVTMYDLRGRAAAILAAASASGGSSSSATKTV